jgi:Golgi apparatus protein 1
MKFVLMSIVAAAVMLPAAPAAAQEPAAAEQGTLLDYLVASCEGDLEKYCSEVTPGEGRLLYCVAAHEDKLSGQCSYALYEAASLLVELADAVADVAIACEADIESLCGSVEAGEGRVLSCLDANKAKVSQPCKDAVTKAIAD